MVVHMRNGDVARAALRWDSIGEEVGAFKELSEEIMHNQRHYATRYVPFSSYRPLVAAAARALPGCLRLHVLTEDTRDRHVLDLVKWIKANASAPVDVRRLTSARFTL